MALGYGEECECKQTRYSAGLSVVRCKTRDQLFILQRFVIGRDVHVLHSGSSQPGGPSEHRESSEQEGDGLAREVEG